MIGLNDRSLLSKEDIASLANLSCYGVSQPAGYLDIDELGHVYQPYPESWSTSVYRTTWGRAWYGNSDSIPKLTQLFDRVYQTSRFGEDHFDELSKATEGLRRLKTFYKNRNRTEVVKKVDEVILCAVRTLLAMSKPSDSAAKRPRNDVARLIDLTRSVIGGVSGTRTLREGVSFYIDKIGLFLDRFEVELSPATKNLLRRVKEELEFSLHVDDCANMDSSLYGKCIVNDMLQRDLKREAAEVALDHLDGLPVDEQKSLGILLNSGFKTRTIGNHYAPVGVLKKDGEYILLQCNAGGAAMGDYSVGIGWQNMPVYLSNFRMPFEIHGESVVSFGPYSRDEMLELIPRIIGLPQKICEDYPSARDEYQSFFDKKRKLPSDIPPRRFQTMGNCGTHNVKEWIIHSFQRRGLIEEINSLLSFGEERTPSQSPARELVQGVEVGAGA